MWSYMCPIRNMTACKLMKESVIMGLPSHYSTCPSQSKYQIKYFWLKAGGWHKQLLNSVPYATLTQRYVYVLCILNNPLSNLVKN